MILPNFPKNLHEIEHILGRGGKGVVPGTVPPRSANTKSSFFATIL